MKLNDIVEMRAGKNFSRNKGEKDTGVPYTYEDLVRDLSEFAPYQKDKEYRESFINNKTNDENHYLVSDGDVVFSFVSSTAGIISKESEGKVLNQNFAKLIIKDSQIDPRYLCYCLNQSTHLKKQMAVAMQGSTLRRLTPSSLRELDIPILDYLKQQHIGYAYFSLLKRQFLLEQKIKQEEDFVLMLLESQFEPEMNQEEKHD